MVANLFINNHLPIFQQLIARGTCGIKVIDEINRGEISAQGRISVDAPTGERGVDAFHPKIFISLYMKKGRSATPLT